MVCSIDIPSFTSAGVLDSGLLVELVIGPATSGRARWLEFGMTKQRKETA
jgi:hypothetical protein